MIFLIVFLFNINIYQLVYFSIRLVNLVVLFIKIKNPNYICNNLNQNFKLDSNLDNKNAYGYI